MSKLYFCSGSLYCWLCDFIQTGWTVDVLGGGCWGAPHLSRPLQHPWTKHCGWCGPGGVLDAAGRSAGSGKTSSESRLWWSSQSLQHLLSLQQVGSGGAATLDFLRGLLENANHDLHCCCCHCSHARRLIQLRVRWPLLPPAGWRPVTEASTGWLSSHCSLEPRGLPPSRTAMSGQPVNQHVFKCYTPFFTAKTTIWTSAKLGRLIFDQQRKHPLNDADPLFWHDRTTVLWWFVDVCIVLLKATGFRTEW